MSAGVRKGVGKGMGRGQWLEAGQRCCGRRSWRRAMRGMRCGERAAFGAYAAVINAAVGSECNEAGIATGKDVAHTRVEARLRPMSCVK